MSKPDNAVQTAGGRSNAAVVAHYTARLDQAVNYSRLDITAIGQVNLIVNALRSGYYDPTTSGDGVITSGDSRGCLRKLSFLKMERTLSVICPVKKQDSAEIKQWIASNRRAVPDGIATRFKQFVFDAYIYEDGATPWEFMNPEDGQIPCATDKELSVDIFVAMLIREDMLTLAGREEC
jgi:hypothetical protein